MPRSVISWVQRSDSRARCWASSSGVEPTGSAPMVSKRLATSGSFMASSKALLSLLTMALGVAVGMNTANQYNEPEAQPARPVYTAPADGGSVPPTPPEQPQYSAPEQPEKPRRKKKFNGKKLARSAVALVLAAAMGFAGGFVGAKYGGGSKVVIQQVERPASSDSSTDSTGNSISATSGTGLSTAQVAEMVSPSVVVITTEQVVYSQWSWYGQSQVESGAGSGVIISSDGYISSPAPMW